MTYLFQMNINDLRSVLILLIKQKVKQEENNDPSYICGLRKKGFQIKYHTEFVGDYLANYVMML